ncbi:phage tail protein [Halodesulfovibrio aestuarii]|uniref:phage tail protein n=1 Tax=Halodesulfovibrio aestuarii TaxID=126333 RepID=UPI00040AC8E1
MPDFYTVVTDTGLQALGLASTQGQSFSLTHAVVGDGNGLAVIPNKGMTTLVNEVWRGEVAGIKVDSDDPNTFIFEFAIPADTGGFTIREVGLLDESGKLFCIGNFPDTEKPVAVNGSVRDLVVRLPLHFENADDVSLVIDTAVALATKQDVLDHNADPEAHRFATTAQTGFVRLATVEEHTAKTASDLACTPIGVWELLKSVMSSACTSTSTVKIATSKAVNAVYKKIVAHTGDTAVHVPTGGSVGEVLTKNEAGQSWLPASGTQSINIVTFTSSGTYTKPANLIAAEVTVTGGGGSGGLLFSTGAGGGGAGGTSIKAYLASDLGGSETIVVGAGGIGTSGEGSNGGNSSFKYQYGYGGNRPVMANSGGKGDGASGGDINLYGGGGDSGSNEGYGGAGGASYWGGNGVGVNSVGTPLPTILDGHNGGGGAGRDMHATLTRSGHGGNGLIVIKEYLR